MEKNIHESGSAILKSALVQHNDRPCGALFVSQLAYPARYVALTSLVLAKSLAFVLKNFKVLHKSFE